MPGEGGVCGVVVAVLAGVVVFGADEPDEVEAVVVGALMGLLGVLGGGGMEGLAVVAVTGLVLAVVMVVVFEVPVFGFVPVVVVALLPVAMVDLPEVLIDEDPVDDVPVLAAFDLVVLLVELVVPVVEEVDVPGVCGVWAKSADGAKAATSKAPKTNGATSFLTCNFIRSPSIVPRRATTCIQKKGPGYEAF